MKSFAVLIATTLALASAAPATVARETSSIVVADPGSALGAKINLSIPPSCAVCDSLGLGCVAACLAGGPADPLCDICAGGALGIVTQCLTVRKKNCLHRIAE